MSEKVTAFGEEIEIDVCPTCQGTGNSQYWDRKTQTIEENSQFCCETCKGAKYIVVSHWKKQWTGAK